jgi:hypothetical protein
MTMRNFFCEPLLLLHYSIEHRMQICLRNPIIACSTDLVGNIPLTKLTLNFKNNDDI